MLRSGDVNGDGLADLIGVRTDNSWFVRLHNGPEADLLTGVTDGLDNTFNPSYHTLTNWPYNAQTGEGYTADAEVTPPATRLVRGGSTHVVSQLTQSTGVGSGTYTTHYAYWNAKVDGTGRGYLGFEKVKATDSRNGLVTETEYNQTFPYLGRAEKVTVWNGSNKVSVYDPSWMKQTLSGVADGQHAAGSYHFVHLDQEVTEAYEVDSDGAHNGQLVRTVTHKTNVSGFPWNYTHGAPTREEVTTTSPQTAETRTSVTERTFHDGVAAWCLGLPATVSVTKSDGVNTPPARQVAFTYYSHCRPWTETVGTTPGKQLQTTYTYDSYGRLATMAQDAPGAPTPARQVTVQYGQAGDTAGVRPTSETTTVDGVAHAVGHAWNNALGLETARTDPQGQSTSWTHDAFGRLTKETRPAGNSTFTYTACPSCWPSKAKYKVRESRSDSFWADSFRDGYGREVGTTSLLADGTQVRRLFTYDELGRMTSERLPYKVGESYYGVEYTYDLLGRPKIQSRQVSETDTSTQQTTWIYDRLTTSVTDAKGHVRAFATDAEGNLTAVQEPSPGGTTSYGYTPWGELDAVHDAAGHTTTTMSYDERGFRTEVNDLDAGSSVYEYTVWGELYRMRDARTAAPNWTLTNSYDALGRPTERVDYDPVTAVSATTTWAYYTSNDTGSGARLGLLQTVTSDVGGVIEFQEVYKYTGKAQVRQKKTKISGAPSAWYFTDLTYDNQGRPSTITYPVTVSGLRPRFDYTYSRGYLDTVTQVENGVSYPRYDLVDMDARGHESRVSLGGAQLDVQTLYDRVTGLVNEIRTGPGLGTGVQNLAYAWDRVGNLTSRTDNNQSLTEAFTYDDLNRLKESTLNGVPNLQTNYLPDGSLDTKRRPDGTIQSYAYATPGKPHAVSATTTGTSTDYYTYDAAGQLLNRAYDSPSAFNRWVSWTAFGKPKQVSAGAANCAADCTTFTYGPQRQLVKQVVKAAGSTRSIYYIGPHFEVEVSGSVTKYRSHVFADGRVVFSQIEDSGGVGWQAYYPLYDHLGSVDKQYQAIGGGAQTLAYSYDAYGRRRNADWSDDPGGTQMATPSDWNHRGYTGHEMLDNVALIHMKGRVYDPTLGMFLSPDPVLNDLRSPQGINRYGYVAGNPLAYTDPTGYTSGKDMNLPPVLDIPDITVWTDAWVDFVSLMSWAITTASYLPVPLGAPSPDYGSGSWTADNSIESTTPEDKPKEEKGPGVIEGGIPTGGRLPSVGYTAGPVAAEEGPQGQEDSADPICNASGLGGGGLTLSQRADRARLQALGGVVGGGLLGYGAAIGYNAHGLHAGGALVQGGSRQGNLAYGAAAQGLGIPLQAAQRFAGFYEQYGPNSGGRYAPENGTFYGDPPYGDDPGAQQAITEGYACGQ